MSERKEGLSAGDILRAQGRGEEAQAFDVMDCAEEGSVKPKGERARQVRALVDAVWTRDRSFLEVAGPWLEPSSDGSVLGSRLAGIARDHVHDGSLYDEKTGRLSRSFEEALIGAGAFSALIPEEFGGQGLSKADLLYAEWRISRQGGFHGAAQVTASTVIGLVGPVIRHGTAGQRLVDLRAVAEGRPSFFALTERDAGVNVPGMGAYAIRDGDGWKLYARREEGGADNRKWYITNVRPGARGIVIARLGSPDAKEFGMFLVDCPAGDTLTFQYHGYPLGPFSGLYNQGFTLDGHRVEDSDRIPFDGLKALFENLNEGRTSLGAKYRGLLEYLLAQAVHFVKVRLTLGGVTLDTQMLIKSYLAELAALITGIASLTELTARLIREGNDCRLEATIVKVYTARASARAAYLLQMIFGGRIFQNNHPVGRFRDDLTVVQTFEGPDPMISMKGFELVVNPHKKVFFDPLEPVLRSLGIKRLDPLSLKGAHAGLKLLGKGTAWKYAGWLIAEATRNGVDRFSFASDLAPTLNGELRAHAARAQREFNRTGLRTSVTMSRRGLELFDEQPITHDEAARLVDVTGWLTACYWSSARSPQEQSAAMLLSELTQQNLNGGSREKMLPLMMQVADELLAVDEGLATHPLIAGIEAHPELFTA